MIGRMERAYARLAFECAESLQEKYPELDAEAKWIAGGVALFAGAESPLTQAHGMGFDGVVLHEHLEELEDFYAERDCVAVLDACEAADESLFEVLLERGYRVTDTKHVLSRSLDDFEELEEPEVEDLTILVGPGPEWGEVVAEGFYPDIDLPLYLRAIFHTYLDIETSVCFLAFIGDEPAGGGALGVYDEIGMLYSASVLPEFRGRGIQKALLHARMEYARAAGCDYAMVFTAPNSTSEQNVMKIGFEKAYEKYKLVAPSS